MAVEKAISDEAEARFIRYLTERGYGFEHEPDLGIQARPDFSIDAAGQPVVAEVKAFASLGLFKDLSVGTLGTRSIKEALKPVRSQISTAAEQLRELRDSGLPLVVVLANPAGRPIPLEPYLVISAMYGDMEIQAPLRHDGSLGDVRSVLGRNGKLTNDHSYISAVAVIRREVYAAQWAATWFDEHRPDFGGDTTAMITAFSEASKDAPEGDDLYLEVFETVSSTAVPLPRTVFDGPKDRRWIANADRTGLIPLVIAQSGAYPDHVDER